MTPKIDALVDLTGRVADQGGSRFRTLNRRKGPAVRGPRAQADCKAQAQAMQCAIREAADLSVIESEKNSSRRGTEVWRVGTNG